MPIRLQLDFTAPSDTAFRPRLPLVSVRRWFAGLRTLAVRWRERRLLEQLDHRTLRDIGITRSEALAEANKPWWRK